jgi:phage gp36-like protein
VYLFDVSRSRWTLVARRCASVDSVNERNCAVRHFSGGFNHGTTQVGWDEGKRIGRQAEAAAKNKLAFVLFTEVFGRNTVEFETCDGDFPEATGLDGMIFKWI